MRPRRFWQPNSLIFSAGWAMMFVTVLAFAGMGLSILVAQWTEGDARAINVAGSMRMQSYRIATLMLTERDNLSAPAAVAPVQQRLAGEMESFAKKLEAPAIRKATTSLYDDAVITSYQRVVERWEAKMVPALSVLVAADSPAPRRREALADYLREVDVFVGYVNEMVLRIQQNSERKIRWVGLGEGLTSLLTLGAAFVIMFLIRINLVVPLKDLVAGAHRVAAGDFTYRTHYRGKNELGLLCSTYNTMAESLAEQYQLLEETVDKKTRELQESNHTLAFLYRVSRCLLDSSYSPDVVEGIAEELMHIVGLEHLSVCLSPVPNEQRVDWIEPSSSGCNRRAGSDYPTTPQQVQRLLEAGCQTHEMALPVSEQGEHFGYIYVARAPAEAISPLHRRLLASVAELLGVSMLLLLREAQGQRLVLEEERAVIARELHDSLAQSLSYMKIQVAWLKTQIKRECSIEVLSPGVVRLQEALNGAYRQLRELLTTFRLKLDKPTLYAALTGTVAEFEARAEVPITLTFDLHQCQLGPNEDIHVLQIVREALTNAVKHARAGGIEIRCFVEPEAQVVVSVRDNGIGMPEDIALRHHYGMAIMKERARSLGGDVTVENHTDGGVEVRLVFIPQTAVKHLAS